MLIVRFILLNLWFFSSCSVVCFLALFRPFSPITCERFSRIISPVANWIIGIKLVVKNRSQLYSSQPCVFIFNHQSLVDAFTIAAAVPGGTVAVGKKSLQWIPIFGWLFYLSGSLLIDRKNSIRAMATMAKAKEKLQRNNISVLMAPEGTRSGKNPMGAFKKGAFYLAVDTGFPLQPLVASSYHKSLDYWNFGRSGVVIVEALEPIPTKGLTHEDVGRLIEIARERMRLAVERLDEEVSALRRPRE